MGMPMNSTPPRAGLAALFLAGAVAAGSLAQADDVAPVRLDRDLMAGVGLTAIPPDAYADILVAGELNMRVASLFEGAELSVSVFASTPATTDHRTRPTDMDEFVTVLSGKLILTEPNGSAHEFLPGDSFVLPVGYTGTWEMQGDYRELVVLMQK
jgi:uncharacterized cupin superfamily protein